MANRDRPGWQVPLCLYGPLKLRAEFEAPRTWLLTTIIAVLALLCRPAAAGLIEERVGLQVVFPCGGRMAALSLDALIVRPDDHRPHPLAVINHGAP
jgi:hypothetical protein